MKLLENYSLQLGQRISKAWTYEKYYPIPFENYIVFQPWSKPAKNYDYWDEVITLIRPILEQHNIKIVQVGAKDEKPVNFCHHTQGKTNWGQLQYIISKSKLILSTDSVSVHFAGYYNIPLVCLTSNNYKEVVSPYFGDKNKQIILEPDRQKYLKPSFQLDEGLDKQINSINPEEIAGAVCKLLNLPFNYNYKTISIGKNYQNKIVESVGDGIINVQQLGIPNLIMRLDYGKPNYAILIEQLKISKCAIICKEPIPLNILKDLRGNIIEVLYKIDSNHNPTFVKELQDNKIPYRLFSDLSDDELNKIKLDYLDFNIITKRDISIPEKLKDKDLSKVHFKCNKYVMGRGKFYQSYYDFKLNRNFDPNNQQPQSVFQNPWLNELWCEKDYCIFSEKVLT